MTNLVMTPAQVAVALRYPAGGGNSTPCAWCAEALQLHGFSKQDYLVCLLLLTPTTEFCCDGLLHGLCRQSPGG